MSVIKSRQLLQTTNGRFIEHRRGESEQTANDIQTGGPLAIADDSSRRKFTTTRRRWSKTTRSTTHRQTAATACCCRCCSTAASELSTPTLAQLLSVCCQCSALRSDNYVRCYVTASVPQPLSSSSSYSSPASHRPVLVAITFSFTSREHLVAVKLAVILLLIMPKATDNYLSCKCQCLQTDGYHQSRNGKVVICGQTFHFKTGLPVAAMTLNSNSDATVENDSVHYWPSAVLVLSSLRWIVGDICCKCNFQDNDTKEVSLAEWHLSSFRFTGGDTSIIRRMQNSAKRLAAADPQTKQTDVRCEYRLLSSTPTIAN